MQTMAMVDKMFAHIHQLSQLSVPSMTDIRSVGSTLIHNDTLLTSDMLTNVVKSASVGSQHQKSNAVLIIFAMEHFHTTKQPHLFETLSQIVFDKPFMQWLLNNATIAHTVQSILLHNLDYICHLLKIYGDINNVYNQCTLLNHAIMNNKYKEAQFLLAHGACWNVPNTNYNNVVMLTHKMKMHPIIKRTFANDLRHDAFHGVDEMINTIDILLTRNRDAIKHHFACYPHLPSEIFTKHKTATNQSILSVIFDMDTLRLVHKLGYRWNASDLTPLHTWSDYLQDKEMFRYVMSECTDVPNVHRYACMIGEERMQSLGYLSCLQACCKKEILKEKMIELSLQKGGCSQDCAMVVQTFILSGDVDRYNKV